MDKPVDLPVVEPRIRQLRESKGLTQAELATQAGVTRKTIWNLETGNTLPNLAILLAIAIILGVAWSELYEVKGGKT